MNTIRVLILVAMLLPVAPPLASLPQPPIAGRVADLWGLAAATTPDGHLWAVWADDDGHDTELFYSRWAEGAWAAPRVVQAAPDTWESRPSLAVADDGTLWLAWTAERRDGSEIYLSRWDGHRWTTPQQLPRGPALEAEAPALAAAPGGALWLAWVGFDGLDDEIYASRWQAGDWSAPLQVSADDDQPHLYDRQPRLAVAADGTAWLAWTGHNDGADDEIYAARWDGSAWSPEQAVSTDDETLDISPDLILDDEGRPWLAWTARLDSRRRILVSYWDEFRGAWADETLVSSPLDDAVDEARPALALDGEGTVHLAWLVAGPEGRGLAHTWRFGARWLEPRLARAAVETHDLRLVPGEKDTMHLLWPDLSPYADVPLALETAGKTEPPLSDWLEGQTPEETIQVDPIPNRFLAFGDSITWGQYPVDDPVQPPFHPYPSTLDDTLDNRVMDADVINVGEPGEGTGNGMDRIKIEVQTYTPQYVMIMEGTNNVSHDALPSEIYQEYLIMIDNAKKHAGVDHVKVMMATLIPRLDSRNDETEEMNQLAVIPAANDKKIPICDQWGAFYDYIAAHGIPLADIYWDEKHPNQEGLDLFAAKWYSCLLSSYDWLNEEATPPTTWIDSAQEGQCGQVDVTWTGTDNLSWVVNYDVQRNVNGGAWTDWQMATTATAATYQSQNFGDVVGFRVRGRDLVGNQSDWSDPVYASIRDATPPTAWMNALLPYRRVPFVVSWQGTDTCSTVIAYHVQYRVGPTGTWQDWLNTTPNTSAVFSPASPQYGQAYYFQVRALDVGGNWSPWSAPVQTTLIQYSLTGHVYNVRGRAVAQPQVSVDPAPIYLGGIAPGGFEAYLFSAGDYDLSAARPDLYGALPAMLDLAVAGDVEGLTFVLPPHDDAVADGGFETGDLSAWQVSGSQPPALSASAHTGLGAIQMGGPGLDAALAQAITPAPALSNPTLSFMVRLEGAGPAGALQITLADSGGLSPPLTYTLAVDSEAWTHVWYDLTGLADHLSGLAGQASPFTLTFTVSDSSLLLLDEVSLGSALDGAHLSYLPLLFRH
jgi:lysophospholipase L1-like esterase